MRTGGSASVEGVRALDREATADEGRREPAEFTERLDIEVGTGGDQPSAGIGGDKGEGATRARGRAVDIEDSYELSNLY